MGESSYEKTAEPKTFDLRAAIEDGMARHFAAEQALRPAPEPRRHLYASGWHPCRRNLYLQMTRPMDRKPFDASGSYRVRRGNYRERDILRDLAIFGESAPVPFRVVRQAERIVIRRRNSEAPLITGYIDATIVSGSGRPSDDVAIPIEIKSWLWIADRAQTAADLESSIWTRGGDMQLLAYLYAKSLPTGYLILDAPDRPNPIRIDLEERWDRIARFVEDAEVAIEAVESGEAPAFFGDHEECRACTFYGRACNPPIEPKGTLADLSTDVLNAAARSVCDLEAPAVEYTRAREVLRDATRGVPVAIVGDYVIKGRPHGKGWTISVHPVAGKEVGDVRSL